MSPRWLLQENCRGEGNRQLGTHGLGRLEAAYNTVGAGLPTVGLLSAMSDGVGRLAAELTTARISEFSF